MNSIRKLAAGFLERLIRLALRPTLPQTSGELRLDGLEGEVEVLRDRWGVPQIFAGNERDLFFAQGYVHAQDRLFQMEIQRRTGMGRLAELLGEDVLEFDLLFRTLNLPGIAHAAVDRASREILEILHSYTAGINAYLKTGPLPPELRLLRHEPEPWAPPDVAAWSLVMAWGLSTNWHSEMLRSPGAAVPESRSSWSGPQTVPGGGSNNWAVAPSRSASDSALLASDPHLRLGIPGFWYELGLYAGRYRVVGATLPGAPGVLIGHNREIAWGVTAALTDVQDLYIERFHPDDPVLYSFRGEWRKAEVRQEEVKVRGRREPVSHRVRTTVHGPVITDVTGGGEELALRWATPEPDRMLESVLALNRAGSWREFLHALRHWSVPGQNFVYADRRGNIGYALAGPVPKRSGHLGDRPVPGSGGRCEWEGYVPFDRLPKVLNPGSGHVSSANNPPYPGNHPDYIPGEYDPGYRARRIRRLLEGTDRHTLESFRRMQADLYSEPAHRLAGMLARIEPAEDVPPALMRELESWDGHLTAGSRAGAVAGLALQRLIHRAGSGLAARPVRLIDPAVRNLLLARTAPQALRELKERPDANEALRELLSDTVSELRQRLGADPGRWRWGALHRADFPHTLGVVKPLGSLLNRTGYPVGGDAFTLWQAASVPEGDHYAVTTAPTYRQLIDTGDWENSRSLVVPGQSGNVASPHYDDALPFWLTARYRPMVFERRMAELATRERLVLKPGERATPPLSAPASRDPSG
jgi:penicillin amidase